MERDKSQKAYNYLIYLASSQGYITFDEIMDCADKHSLPIQDFNWLCNAITSRGIIVYNEIPSSLLVADNDEYDDFAQSDYDAVYARIIELSPSLEPFVNAVRNIIPPQRQEINQLKYQIVDGNDYARARMIEMHLRIALKLALQRAESFDMDIEDAIGYACIGLIMAVDKYEPDTSKAFSSYASLWILQNISREQSTRRHLIYYPVHQKENYFSMYPSLKKYGCVECLDLAKCEKVRQMIIDKLECSNKDAEIIVTQITPDLSLEKFIAPNDEECDLYQCEYEMIDGTWEHTAHNIIISEEDALQTVYDKILCEDVAKILKKLTPREVAIIKLRYGFDLPEQTLEQVGEMYNITRERVRQIEVKVFKKLRISEESKKLKDYW